jgi:hypothetical protein
MFERNISGQRTIERKAEQSKRVIWIIVFIGSTNYQKVVGLSVATPLTNHNTKEV